jgi:hypothetical protein
MYHIPHHIITSLCIELIAKTLFANIQINGSAIIQIAEGKISNTGKLLSSLNIFDKRYLSI